MRLTENSEKMQGKIVPNSLMKYLNEKDKLYLETWRVLSIDKAKRLHFKTANSNYTAKKSG